MQDQESNLEEKAIPSILKYDILSRIDSSIFISILPESSDQSSKARWVFPNFCHKSDAWSYFNLRGWGQIGIKLGTNMMHQKVSKFYVEKKYL